MINLMFAHQVQQVEKIAAAVGSEAKKQGGPAEALKNSDLMQTVRDLMPGDPIFNAVVSGYSRGYQGAV